MGAEQHRSAILVEANKVREIVTRGLKVGEGRNQRTLKGEADALKYMREAADTLAVSGTSTPAIEFLDHDEMYEETDDTSHLVVPELGIGPGPVHDLLGPAYAGKTLAAMAMGMAVATGTLVWGKYPCKAGVWVHLDYEQGKRETSKRLRKFTRGMGLDREATRGKVKIASFPRVDLTSESAVEHFVQAMKGATLCTVDSLRAMTPGIEENSSELRNFVHVLSVASERTGCAVIMIHHTGKDPEKGGRGTSAIKDECQSEFILTGDKDTKTVKHTKDRALGRTVDDITLHYEDTYLSEDDVEPIGLRVVVVGAEELDHKNEEKIVAFLRDQGGTFTGTRSALVRAMGGNRGPLFAALKALSQGGTPRVAVDGNTIRLVAQADIASVLNDV